MEKIGPSRKNFQLAHFWKLAQRIYSSTLNSWNDVTLSFQLSVFDHNKNNEKRKFYTKW